ncbi:MAG: thioredoxin [Bacteroidales bacterium]|nr:thioredoxin [Bacteroidales bacterium]MEE1225779.1 thioredoxin [Bacteroidales bacterium]
MRVKRFNILLVFLFLFMFSCGEKQNSKIEEKQVVDSSKVIEIDAKYFIDDIAKIGGDSLTFIGDKSTIVDFYASWCGPCKKLSPIMEKLSKKYEDKVNFYKIDVDKSSDLANALNIRAIPTLIFFKDSSSSAIIMEGFMSETELEHHISSYLLK